MILRSHTNCTAAADIVLQPGETLSNYDQILFSKYYKRFGNIEFLLQEAHSPVFCDLQRLSDRRKVFI